MRFREKYVLFFAKIQQTLQSTILLFAYLISVKRLCTESQEVSATKKAATFRESRGFDYGEKSVIIPQRWVCIWAQGLS